MQDVRVAVHIAAPIERVFAALTDHEKFLRSAEGTTAKILRPGTTERDGLGCFREVRHSWHSRYVEEITAWERPFAFEYVIRDSSMPLRHLGSRIALRPQGDGTAVEWASRFEVTTPFVGRLLGSAFKRLFTLAFTDLLVAAKPDLEAGG